MHPGPPGWGLCCGLTTYTWKKQVTETNNNYNQKSSVSGRTEIPFKEFMTRCSQTHQGAAGLKTHSHPKILLFKNSRLLSQNSVFLRTWNVRTLWGTRRCAQAARKMQRYNLTLMGLCEVRGTGHGETKLQTGETLLYSGKNEERHEANVRLFLSKKAANSAGMESWVRPHHHSTLQEGIYYYVLCTRQLLKRGS